MERTDGQCGLTTMSYGIPAAPGGYPNPLTNREKKWTDHLIKNRGPITEATTRWFRSVLK